MSGRIRISSTGTVGVHIGTLRSSGLHGLRLSYCHAPDAWPWRYEAVEEIGLADGALCIRLILRNLSDEPMPAGGGLHPYFPAPPATKFTTDVAAMWETDSEVLPNRLVRAAGRLDALDVRDHAGIEFQLRR